MKYIVQASNVTEVYEVKKFTNDDGTTFYQKPEYVKNRIDDWVEELYFECDHLEYNSNQEKYFIGLDGLHFLDGKSMNLSENEEVQITKQIFRADKATTYLYSNKVLSLKEDKETNWDAYQNALIEYRDYVFDKYPAVKEYCELHCIKDELENIDKIKELVLRETSVGYNMRVHNWMEQGKSCSHLCL